MGLDVSVAWVPRIAACEVSRDQWETLLVEADAEARSMRLKHAQTVSLYYAGDNPGQYIEVEIGESYRALARWYVSDQLETGDGTEDYYLTVEVDCDAVRGALKKWPSEKVKLPKRKR